MCLDSFLHSVPPPRLFLQHQAGGRRPPPQQHHVPEADPVGAQLRLRRKDRLARLTVALEIACLDLKHGQVALHERCVAQPQRGAVALDRLNVVAVRAVDEPVDVPREVTPHLGLHQALLGKRVGLLLARQEAQRQRLERQRIAMFGRRLEDRIARLERALVQLLIVQPRDRLERRGLLGLQLLRRLHSTHRTATN
jgi:hypothetical protein